MPSNKRLTLQQKVSIRDRNGRVLVWAAEQYGVKPHISTIRRIVKDDRSYEQANIATSKLDQRCNLRTPKFLQLDTLVYNWVVLANSKGACVTGAVIVRKALEFARALRIDGQVACSLGWLVAFQRRHNLKMYRLHGEAASVDTATVETGRARLLAATAMYDRPDIYNMDETGLFYNYQPCTTISDEPRKGQKKDKSRITVALTANADGTHKLQPFFIGKAKRPRCFGSMSGEQLGLLYRNNRKAWMTIALFSDWMGDLNKDMAADNRSILLLLDNASSHSTVSVSLTNVEVLMLPPNTTSLLQPMDAGVIANFKSNYKRRQVDHAITMIDGVHDVAVTRQRNLYAVDVRTVMAWSVDAWNDVSVQTIRNCWNHTAIVPEESLLTQFQALRTSSGHSIKLLLNA